MANTFDEQAKERFMKSLAFMRKAEALLQDDLVYRAALADAVSAIKNMLQGYLLLRIAVTPESGITHHWQEVAASNRMPDLIQCCGEAGLNLRGLAVEIKQLNNERNYRTHDDPSRLIDPAQAERALELARTVQRHIREVNLGKKDVESVQASPSSQPTAMGRIASVARAAVSGKLGQSLAKSAMQTPNAESSEAEQEPEILAVADSESAPASMATSDPEMAIRLAAAEMPNAPAISDTVAVSDISEHKSNREAAPADATSEAATASDHSDSALPSPEETSAASIAATPTTPGPTSIGVATGSEGEDEEARSEKPAADMGRTGAKEGVGDDVSLSGDTIYELPLITAARPSPGRRRGRFGRVVARVLVAAALLIVGAALGSGIVVTGHSPLWLSSASRLLPSVLVAPPATATATEMPTPAAIATTPPVPANGPYFIGSLIVTAASCQGGATQLTLQNSGQAVLVWSTGSPDATSATFATHPGITGKPTLQGALAAEKTITIYANNVSAADAQYHIVIIVPNGTLQLLAVTC